MKKAVERGLSPREHQAEVERWMKEGIPREDGEDILGGGNCGVIEARRGDF